MAGQTRHLFARGNTARGAHSLFDSAFAGLTQIYLLTGYPGTGKSTLLKRIADEATSNGESVELFHSALNPDDLDAVILTDRQIGIADESAAPGAEAIPGAQITRIDLSPAVDLSKLSPSAQQEIAALHTQVAETLQRAYASFATALRIHDEWEAPYIGAMAFDKADQVGQELIAGLFTEAQPKPAQVRHLFFGAATPKGAVDHIPALTSHLDRRIFIKGRPGSGKSTLLKRLASAAEAKGYDVEVFHCGFDPNSLDMLIFPELRLALFDSTAPHEYFPSLPIDEILDMYERTMAPGTDERYAAQIGPIQERYKAQMQGSIALLQEAQALHLRLRSHYAACTDFAKVDQIGQGLLVLR